MLALYDGDARDSFDELYVVLPSQKVSECRWNDIKILNRSIIDLSYLS